MRKRKNVFWLRPALLFAVSGVLLFLSTVGSTRAALNYYSENYEVRLNVSSIGVSLLENGKVVSSRNYIDNEWSETSRPLLENMLDQDEKLVLGRKYSESLAVENSGAIDSYVRVILYKNWTKDEEEAADTELSPDLIRLELTGEDWIEDTNASTRERTVLYYTKVVPSGGRTPAFCSSLSLDPSIGRKVTVSREGSTIRTAYAYDGYRFNLRAEVDTVQNHNAEEAIKSAWGVNVSVSADGTLSLGGADD